MDDIQEQTLQLIKEKGIIDCHCDTITNLLPSAKIKYNFSEENKWGATGFTADAQRGYQGVNSLRYAR